MQNKEKDIINIVNEERTGADEDAAHQKDHQQVADHKVVEFAERAALLAAPAAGRTGLLRLQHCVRAFLHRRLSLLLLRAGARVTRRKVRLLAESFERLERLDSIRLDLGVRTASASDRVAIWSGGAVARTHAQRYESPLEIRRRHRGQRTRPICRSPALAQERSESDVLQETGLWDRNGSLLRTLSVRSLSNSELEKRTNSERLLICVTL